MLLFELKSRPITMEFKVNLMQRSRSRDFQNIKQDWYLLECAIR